MMHKRIFGPHSGAGTESLYRSQYSHCNDPLWIITNPDPCFYWRWQGTTGLFFPLASLGTIYSSPLATLRAFWSLEPQAYLVKTLSGKNMQQNLNSWCISKSSGLILRWAHVAPCSVVSVRSMKSQEQTFYCSYLLQMHHISSRTCSYFRACRGQICWFQLSWNWVRPE